MSKRLLGTALIAAGMICAAACPAHADAGPPEFRNAARTSPAARTGTAASTAIRIAGASREALSDSDLGNCRGSGGLVVGNQTLNAISSGNSTFASYSAGAVNFSDEALSNFNGFGNITVNTGALSQLQSAMNITVNVTP